MPDERSQTALAELAALVLQLRRRPRLARDPRAERCLDALERAYRRPGLHEFPFRVEPRALVGHVLIWLALAPRDSQAIVPRARLQSLVDAGGVLADTREPYRALELRYVLDRAGLRHALPSAAELFRRTVLGGVLLPPALDPATAYAVTHTVFYATDYGLARPAYLEEARRRGILDVVRRSLRAMLDVSHWDLVGELVLAHACLARDPAPILVEAWSALAGVQDASGAVGPALPLPAPWTGDAFLGRYHMTLVAAMAGFLGIPETRGA